MKLMALERELHNPAAEMFRPYLKAEAAHVWDLYQAGILRELYFRADQQTAVLVMECADAEAARAIPDSFPLVKAGLIAFDILPLVPYSGFARLFATA